VNQGLHEDKHAYKYSDGWLVRVQLRFQHNLGRSYHALKNANNGPSTLILQHTPLCKSQAVQVLTYSCDSSHHFGP